MDLRILHLHPSVLNVAGDGGNVRAVEQRAKWRGIDVEIRRGDPGDALDPAWPDITIVGGGQDTEMRVAADGLRDQAGALRDSVEAGGVIFAVCAGLQLLGRTYVPTTGDAIEGLGMLDLETRGGPTRFMQHAACEVELDGTTSVVVGFENHSGLTELGPDAKPFGTVVLGAGNNGVDGTEGARPADGSPILSTYLHGPVLPKNPWLTDHLLTMALSRRHGRVELSPLADATEDRAHDEALAAAERARGRRTAIPAARLGRQRFRPGGARRLAAASSTLAAPSGRRLSQRRRPLGAVDWRVRTRGYTPPDAEAPGDRGIAGQGADDRAIPR